MKYNPKGMIRGALLGAAGLALAVSTSCQTKVQHQRQREWSWHINMEKNMEVTRYPNIKFVEGKLSKAPTILPGNCLQLNMQDKRGSNTTYSLQYSNKEEAFMKDLIVPDLVRDGLENGAMTRLGYLGTNDNGRLTEAREISVKQNRK